MSCEVCPEDTYKEADQYYATDCTPCPAESPVTIGDNSTSRDDCRFGKSRIYSNKIGDYIFIYLFIYLFGYGRPNRKA